MVKRLFWLIAVAVGACFGAQAQDTAPIGPIGTVAAGDFRALAVTSGGDRLLIADAENNQLRIYNFSDPSSPALLTSVDLDGEPVALAAADNFALVAVTTGESTDAVRVIAPSVYARQSGYLEANSIDIPRAPRTIRLSPDNRWAVVVSERGYSILELISAGEINSLPFAADASPVIDAAVANNTAYLLHDSSLEIQSLRANLAIQRTSQIEFEGQAAALALNTGITLGVVALDDNQLVFFDPVALETVSTLSLEGEAIAGMQFVSGEEGEWLAITQADSTDITLIDVSNPADVGELGTLATSFAAPVQAMVSYDTLIAATDGQTVSIFQVR